MAGIGSGLRQVVDLVTAAADSDSGIAPSAKRRRWEGGGSGPRPDIPLGECPGGGPEVIDLVMDGVEPVAPDSGAGGATRRAPPASRMIDLADVDCRKGWPGGKRRKQDCTGCSRNDIAPVAVSLAGGTPPLASEEEKGTLLAENQRLQEQLQLLREQLDGERGTKSLLAAPPPQWKVADGVEPPLFKFLVGQGESVDDLMRHGGSSSDLCTVVKRFEEASQLKRRHIVQVTRVQNLKLWTKFQLLQEDINEKVPKGKTNTRQLWHGADMATLETICREGFDFRVSQPGGALGQGAYFAKCSAYSDSYSARQPHSAAGHPCPSGAFSAIASGSGVRAMLLCLVHLGRVTTGAPGLRKPPPGADSVSDSGRSIFAVFDNAQAYPQYVVHYRR